MEVSCGPDECRVCTNLYDEQPHYTPTCPAKLATAKQGLLHAVVMYRILFIYLNIVKTKMSITHIFAKIVWLPIAAPL